MGGHWERHGKVSGSGKDGVVPEFYLRGEKYSSGLERAPPDSLFLCAASHPQPAWWWAASGPLGREELALRDFGCGEVEGAV